MSRRSGTRALLSATAEERISNVSVPCSRRPAADRRCRTAKTWLRDGSGSWEGDDGVTERDAGMVLTTGGGVGCKGREGMVAVK